MRDFCIKKNRQHKEDEEVFFSLSESHFLLFFFLLYFEYFQYNLHLQ